MSEKKTARVVVAAGVLLVGIVAGSVFGGLAALTERADGADTSVAVRGRVTEVSMAGRNPARFGTVDADGWPAVPVRLAADEGVGSVIELRGDPERRVLLVGTDGRRQGGGLGAGPWHLAVVMGVFGTVVAGLGAVALELDIDVQDWLRRRGRRPVAAR